MKKYQLWLDESGNFKNDREQIRQGLHPSLIGGVFFESSSVPASIADKIIPEEQYHSTESDDGNEIFSKFQKVCEQDAMKIALFSNEEGVCIVDDNITYLNLMAEGLLKLYRQLKRESSEELSLQVLIAVRRNTNVEYIDGRSGDIIKANQHLSHLVERIQRFFLDKDTEIKSEIQKDHYIIHVRKAGQEDTIDLYSTSARQEKKLMIADVICNTFFTRGGKNKFSEEQRKYINEIFMNHDKVWKFSVLEEAVKAQLEKLIIERQYGEALTLVCGTKQKVKDYINMLFPIFLEMDAWELELQYRIIAAKIDYEVKCARDYYVVENFLLHLRDLFLLPIGEQRTDYAAALIQKMIVDVNFHLLTVYSHQGRVEDFMKLEGQLDREMVRSSYSLEDIIYTLSYKHRRLINKMNLFAYEETIALCDELIQIHRDIKELSSMLAMDEGDRVRNEELGKLFGTKGQLFTFTLRDHPERYEEAAGLFREALEEFERVSDRSREYLYLCKLEIEAGHFENAEKNIRMAMKEQASDTESVIVLMEKEQNRDFLLSHFMDLLAEGKRGLWERADELYEEFAKSTVLLEAVRTGKSEHPYELIWWKLGSYLLQNGNLRSAGDFYQKAREICFKDHGEVTFFAIGMAIELEEYAFLCRKGEKEAGKRRKSLQSHAKKMEQTILDASIREPYSQIDFSREDWSYYDGLSRLVTY